MVRHFLGIGAMASLLGCAAIGTGGPTYVLSDLENIECLVWNDAPGMGHAHVFRIVDLGDVQHETKNSKPSGTVTRYLEREFNQNGIQKRGDDWIAVCRAKRSFLTVIP